MRTVQVQTVGRFSLMLVVALLTLGVLLMASTEPLVPPAAAGTMVEPTGNGPTGYFSTGNGPTGYFPDTFERIRGEVEPLPPTF